MKRSLVSILALAAIAGCFDDPTSALRNGPSRLRMTLNNTYLDPGEEATVQATVLDDQGNPLVGPVTFSSNDPNLATVEEVEDGTLPGGYGSTALITAGTTAGATYVRATSGGVTDSIYVVVVPPTFTGTVTAVATSEGGITITAPTGLTFDLATAGATVDGLPTMVGSVSATQLVVHSPIAAAGAVLMVEGLVLPGLAGDIHLPATEATTTVTVTEAGEPLNDAHTTAPTIATPAVGQSTVVYGSIDGTDFDDWWSIDLAAGDSIEVSVEWVEAEIDTDMIMTDASGIDEGFCTDDVFGCSGASSDDPETGATTIAATGSYKILVELFDDHGLPTPLVYRLTITRR